MYSRIIILVMSVLVFFGCTKEKGPITSMEDLQKRVNSMMSIAQDVEKKRSELYGLIRTYNSQLDESQQFDITSMDTTIGSSEKELLRSMFKEEKDISFNGLLSTIIEKNDEIRGLNNQIAELRDKLPVPYVVQKNDTHYEIVMDYLITQKGMPKAEAKKVAYSTALIDDILPGNQIWLMYNDGIVGTYVTQGSAWVSPVKYQVIAKKRFAEKSKLLSLNENGSQINSVNN